QATVFQATPTTWRLLVDSGWAGHKRLKALCGGESMSRELASALLERCGELWNMYGPTETTVWSCAGRVTTGEGPISIGRPIANTRILLLDSHFQPVPLGSEGEIYIGGAGIAEGYLNRPELTAERFIPDTFGSDCSGRLYRTGDLGRYLPDGQIVCT